MKAVFNPGPSFFKPEVRKYAGWVHILDLMMAGLQQLHYDVLLPEVDLKLIDQRDTVSKITSWDLVSAVDLPVDIDLFLGPPGYSLAQILKLKAYWKDYVQLEFSDKAAKTFCYVWNNSDAWRDHQLAEEYKILKQPYDLSPTWRWLNATALKLCDRVIACSDFVKDTHAKIEGVGPAKVSIAHWGVDSSRFTPDWEWQKHHPFTVIFSGGDPFRKGLLYLAKALEGLDGIRFVTVGAPQFDGLPRNPDVQLGMVPNDRMPSILREAHVIAIPTLEDGIACAIQEGMASGLVPITSPDAGEVFHHDGEGFVVACRDVASLRERIIYLRDNPRSRQLMATQAWALAQRQTWALFVDEFKEVIAKEMQR